MFWRANKLANMFANMFAVYLHPFTIFNTFGNLNTAIVPHELPPNSRQITSTYKLQVASFIQIPIAC